MPVEIQRQSKISMFFYNTSLSNLQLFEMKSFMTSETFI
jgi:hypothetical protein